ncbi:MAG: M20/M25/M40 family metallo-hydrolase [Oscillospiraceae bacterium]|nr:M20/M25/M40 family metallo-hydrolase [Oscillospiraceae bacterium]
MIELLKKLCALPGPSGREEKVREYIAEYAKQYADEMLTDPMGNLHVFRKGLNREKTLMVCGHMDEIGMIVTGITNDGYLKFDFVGGVDRRVVIGKRVWMGEHRIPGIIGVKAYHLCKGEADKVVPPVSALYIDIGAESKAEAEKLISLGDIGCFDEDVFEFGNGMLKAKAIDDRLGCAVCMKLMEKQPPCDTWYVFTCQEEVGARGAGTAAFRIQPDAAVIVEATTAADLPGVPAHKTICKPGNGAVIPFMDRNTIYNRRFYDALTKLADSHGIKWQTKQMIAGGTDACNIQRSRVGVPVVGIAAALRNIHSPACVGSIADFEAVYQLAELFMEEFAKGDL